MTSEVERLKAAARERWGERWTIKQLHFADGDTSVHAFQSQGQDEEGNLVRHWMGFVDDGSIVVSQEIRNKTVVEEEVIDKYEVSDDA